MRDAVGARYRPAPVSLHVTIHSVGDSLVLSLDGVVDLATVPRFQAALTRAVSKHHGRRIVVDLDGAQAVDDVALGLLLGAAALAREHGGSLDVVSTEPRLRSRLAATRFDLAVTVLDGVV